MKLTKLLSPLFDRFSGSDLSSSNPQKRITGILEKYEPGSSELDDIAINDDNYEVKCCAINRIITTDNIQNVIKNLNDTQAQMYAIEHFSKILSGEVFPVPLLQERERIIKGTIPNKALEYIATHAKEYQLRIQVIKKINRDALLGDIALNDSNAQTRITAAQQLTKKSTLERVTRKSRGKDKRVHKICKDKLNQIVADEQRPQKAKEEITEICDQLQKVYKRNLLVQESSTIINLQKRWDAVSSFANDEIKITYENILNKINLALEALEQQQKKDLSIKEELKIILSQLTNTANNLLQGKEANNHEQIQENLNLVKTYKNSWQEKLKTLSTNSTEELTQQYQNILILIDDSQKKIENLSDIDGLKQYIKQAEQFISSKNHIGEKLVANLQKNFNCTLEQVDQSQLSQQQVKDLHEDFNKKSEQLDKMIQTQHNVLKKLKSDSSDIIAKYNKMLAEGYTDKAYQLKKKYHQLVENNTLISEDEKQEMLNSIHQSDNQLNQLNSWKTWANNRERENLCLQAKDLLLAVQSSIKELETLKSQNAEQIINKKNADIYNQYGEQVKLLRKEWKTLRGKSPDELWMQFNDTCNSCYELFQPYFDQQAQIREKNLKSKQTIIQQLKQYIEHMHWADHKNQGQKDLEQKDSQQKSFSQKTDWIQVNTILRQADSEWKAIGMVDKQHYEKLFKQYKQQVNIIDSKLKQVWDSNLISYNSLIEQVFALDKLIDTDLDKAISEAKNLQKKWKTAGPIQHFQRKKLWKKFRKGCDLVFNKREELNQELNQQNEALVLEKTGLCENLESLVKQEELKISDLKLAFSDINKTWLAVIDPNKSKNKKVNLRYTQAKKDFNKKVEQLFIEDKKSEEKLFHDKVLLCSELELATIAQSDKAFDQRPIKQQWDKLSSIKDKQLESDIANRFQKALSLSEADSAEGFKQIEKQIFDQKHKICLNIEIITEQKTPEEDTKVRMEMQIKQHNEKSINTEDSLGSFVRQWYLLPDFEAHQQLNKRFADLVKST